MVSIHADSANSTAEVWRTRIYSSNPKGNPHSSHVATLRNVKVAECLPTGAVDKNGNIYILERKANAIYTIGGPNNTITTFAEKVIKPEWITLPRIEYIEYEKALLVTGGMEYHLWPLIRNSKPTLFAENQVGVDNFGINETKGGNIIAVHSGQVFRFVHK